MKLLNRSKAIADLADRRWATDPWGLGIEVNLLRMSHPDAQAWAKENEPDNRFVQAFVAHSTYLAVVNQRGGRMKGKMTDEQMAQRAAEKAAEELDTGADKAEQLAKMKPMVANILIGDAQPGEEPRWRGDGLREPKVQCLKCEHVWEADRDDELCPRCQDSVHMSVGEIQPCTAENRMDLLSIADDGNGNPRWLGVFDENDKPIKFGGQPLGDAITEWLLDEARQTDQYRLDYVKAAAENLEPAPVGSTASG